ncbi:unnamed protein product [Oikopleura dioica]|uniref:Uncharacterized protein n=1 Tax=Oikopleura dioica TaxID=34765 RepID=E4XF53_OIKDI|nr:unnamed protein product [Oikopleura dioica]
MQGVHFTRPGHMRRMPDAHQGQQRRDSAWITQIPPFLFLLRKLRI